MTKFPCQDDEEVLESTDHRVKIRRKYAAGHSYDFDYELTALYCPYCGTQHVWAEPWHRGDYYAGPSRRCGECRREFHLP